VGDVFRASLPGFSAIFLVGPQAARFTLVQARDELRWRNDDDPVTRLLRHGVLVEDGAAHDGLRQALNPALHRRMLSAYAADMLAAVEQVSGGWQDGQIVDMLVEMRKVALLALMRTLYRVDFTPELRRLWDALLGCIGYISPGIWMFWRGAPRFGYDRRLREMDAYLYRIIAERKALLRGQGQPPEDMLGALIWMEMEDGLIRDQLLTMLIAGHDTVTALMAWTFYLLGKHPQAAACARSEVDEMAGSSRVFEPEAVNRLEYLGWVLREALRLYPPIHLGNRQAAVDLNYQGYTIPKGSRVIYSIYLTQRHPAYWPEPDRFLPGRYASGSRAAPYAWLAFGGGPRNCIGAAYGQMEARIVVAHILARFDLDLVDRTVRPHMGATLEPRPGVRMRVRYRLNRSG
jgi:cytochrome P450